MANTPRPSLEKTLLKGDSLSKNPEQIEPLKYKAINGYRRRIRSLLIKWGGILGLGTAIGAGAGHMAQVEYRDLTGYKPRPEATQSKSADEEQAAEEQPKEDTEQKGLLSKAKKSLQKAKEWSKKEAGKIIEKSEESELARLYREAKKQTYDRYRGLLKFGDSASYWMPFLIMFLATSFFASKLIEVRKALSQSVDPAVEQRLKEMVAKINELIDRVNAGGRLTRRDISGVEPTVLADIDGTIEDGERVDEGGSDLGAAGSTKLSEE